MAGGAQLAEAARARRDCTIAALALEGYSQSEIGQRIGLSKQRVSQILSDDDLVKEYLDNAQRAQVLLLPLAIQRHAELLSDDDKAIRLKAVQMTYGNTGVAPSHAPVTLVANLYAGGQHVHLEAAAQALWDRLDIPASPPVQSVAVSHDNSEE